MIVLTSIFFILPTSMSALLNINNNIHSASLSLMQSDVASEFLVSCDFALLALLCVVFECFFGNNGHSLYLYFALLLACLRCSLEVVDG